MEQKRIIKFRVWDKVAKRMSPEFHLFGEFMLMGGIDSWLYESGIKGKDSLERLNDLVELRSTGIHDKNKVEIFEGDILEFADKWEWYRGSYGIKMLAANEERRKELQRQYDLEPMERREVSIPESYEWLLSSEIKTYWQVIGNVYSTPNLLEK